MKCVFHDSWRNNQKYPTRTNIHIVCTHIQCIWNINGKFIFIIQYMQWPFLFTLVIIIFIFFSSLYWCRYSSRICANIRDERIELKKNISWLLRDDDSKLSVEKRRKILRNFYEWLFYYYDPVVSILLRALRRLTFRRRSINFHCIIFFFIFFVSLFLSILLLYSLFNFFVFCLSLIGLIRHT